MPSKTFSPFSNWPGIITTQSTYLKVVNLAVFLGLYKILSHSRFFIYIYLLSPFLSVGLASEGVSSGYESMRYESSNNLNTVSDLDSERGKTKSLKRDKKGKLAVTKSHFR